MNGQSVDPSFRFWCALIVLGGGVLIALWDLGAVMSSGRIPTISAAVQDYSSDHPILPFLAGVLMGHLFWRSR